EPERGDELAEREERDRAAEAGEGDPDGAGEVRRADRDPEESVEEKVEQGRRPRQRAPETEAERAEGASAPQREAGARVVDGAGDDREDDEAGEEREERPPDGEPGREEILEVGGERREAEGADAEAEAPRQERPEPEAEEGAEALAGGLGEAAAGE